ncbi:MAG: hypothetical protein CSB55_06110 [Candidatus Cloacimonadota bacterium]|nr:MAG: hypothetical protein CSB55_06110 [Candidatus Cloacimonadota bacterium]
MKNKNLQAVLGIIFGILLLLLLGRSLELEKVIMNIKNVNIKYIVLSSFFYVASYFFRSLRWRELLKPVIAIGRIESFLFWMGGNFINYVIPIRAGELAKSIFLKKKRDISVSASLPSVFIDKMFDFAGIILILALLPFLSIKMNTGLISVISVLVFFAICGTLILIFSAKHQKGIISFFSFFVRKLPEKYHDKINGFIEIFIGGVGLFKNRMNLLPNVLFLTFISVFLDGMFFYMLFEAFSVEIEFLKLLFGYTLIYLSYAIPQPPAQLGSNEWIMLIIFSLGLGMEKNSVSSIMIFSHTLTGILLSVIGIAGISFSGFKFTNLDFRGYNDRKS